MEQPIGDMIKGNEHKVDYLERSIYGRKQLSRQRNLKFNQATVSIDFEMLENDQYVYAKS